MAALPESYVSLALTLFTVLGAGVGSAYLSQRLIRSRDERAFKRVTLEELFAIVRDNCDRETSKALQLAQEIDAAKGGPFPVIDHEWSRAVDTFARASLLTKMYFRRLDTPLSEVRSAVFAMNEKLWLKIRLAKTEPDTPLTGSEVRNAANLVQLTRGLFNEELFEAAQDIK